jgi:hypothetical protein
MSISVPDGWSVKDFGVTLKPGKPEGAMAWFDVQGRPVIRMGRAWRLKPTGGENKPKPQKSQRPEAQAPTQGRTLSPQQRQEINSSKEVTSSRIDKQLNSRLFHDPDTNAKIKSQNEARMKPFIDLDDDEKASLHLYGTDSVAPGSSSIKYYAITNRMLRGGDTKDLSPEHVEMVKFITQKLSSALEKLPAEEKDLDRAVSGNVVASLANLKPGDVFEDKGFGSYTDKGTPTLNTFMSEGGPNAVITVRSKTARKVAPVMQFEKEGEHISLPGTKYKLVGVNEKGVYSRKVGGYVPQYVFEEVSDVGDKSPSTTSESSKPRVAKPSALPQTSEITESDGNAVKAFINPSKNAKEFGHEEINKVLRGSQPVTPTAEKAVQALDHVISKLPSNENGDTYYRAITSSKPSVMERLKSLQPGDTFSDSGVGTYSKDITDSQNAVATRNSSNGVVMVVSRSKNLKNIKQFLNPDWDEDQALLPRDTKLKVKSINTKGRTTTIEVE